MKYTYIRYYELSLYTDIFILKRLCFQRNIFPCWNSTDCRRFIAAFYYYFFYFGTKLRLYIRMSHHTVYYINHILFRLWVVFLLMDAHESIYPHAKRIHLHLIVKQISLWKASRNWHILLYKVFRWATYWRKASFIIHTLDKCSFTFKHDKIF